jgi:ubiquinone/menaquinone biosynthesis C-methylase UbiE
VIPIAIDYEEFQSRRASMRQIGPTHRYKHQLISPILHRLAGMTVLDIGCGAGDFSQAVIDNGGTVYPLDVSLSAAQRTLARCEALPAVASAEDLPYRDGIFDAVLCLDVLEHCEADARAAAEVARVLKPGGVLIVTVPINPNRFDSLDEASGHIRRYTVDELIRLLAPHFEIESTRDYGWPVMSLHKRLLSQVSEAADGLSESGQTSLLTRAVASALFAAMQLDHRFEGNRRGIQALCVGHKTFCGSS